MRVSTTILNQLSKFVFFFFCIGQIGFAVIFIFFFYYFSIILIFGAQINAHFFEEYPPLNDALGTYLSQMYEEHRDINNRESLHDDNHQQQSSTMTDLGQQHRARWINKLCPFKKRHSVEPQSEENNKV
jgi:hypothetical protein